VPKVRGKTERDADAALLVAGCAEGNVTNAYSNTVPKGRVLSQSRRPGAKLPLGTKVNLVVSRGPRA
jgi:beta-lactam-binding protein with PASTA domain